MVAVGNGDGILIIHSHAGSAILHASNIGTIGNCNAICVFHSGLSAIGQHHVADGVLGIGGIVRNGYVDEVNANVHFANVGNSVFICRPTLTVRSRANSRISVSVEASTGVSSTV